MKDFIIDINFIPQSKYFDNVSYYKFNSIIPINSQYKLYIKPYYLNSPHVYRDFYLNFNDLLDDKKIYKKESNKGYNMGICYIPQKPPGSIIKNERIPVKTSLYNIINKPYCIKEINTFDHDLSIDIEKRLYFNLEPLKKSGNLKLLSFFPIDIEISNYFKYVKWRPINNFIIDNNDYYEIDISNFIDKNYIRENGKKISPAKKILILCSYL